MARQEQEAQAVKPNIYQRMNAVMNQCGYVQKDGYNSFSKYKYVTHDAVVEHVRPALVQNGVVVVTRMADVMWPEGATTNAGKTNNVCRVRMVTQFVNADNPSDLIEVEFWGEAADTGDKSIYKAITGAKKYIFTNTFLLATGDDPEEASPEYKQPPAPPASNDPRKDLGDLMRGMIKQFSKLPGGLTVKDFEAQLGKAIKDAEAGELQDAISEVRTKAQHIHAMQQDFPGWKPATRPMEMTMEYLATAWLELKTERVKENQ